MIVQGSSSVSAAASGCESLIEVLQTPVGAGQGFYFRHLSEIAESTPHDADFVPMVTKNSNPMTTAATCRARDEHMPPPSRWQARVRSFATHARRLAARAQVKLDGTRRVGQTRQKFAQRSFVLPIRLRFGMRREPRAQSAFSATVSSAPPVQKTSRTFVNRVLVHTSPLI